MKSLDIINQTINMFNMLKNTTLFIDKNNIDILLEIQKDLKVLKILKKLIKKVDYVKYKGEMRPKLFIDKFSKDLEHDYEIEKIKEWLEEQE